MATKYVLIKSGVAVPESSSIKIDWTSDFDVDGFLISATPNSDGSITVAGGYIPNLTGVDQPLVTQVNTAAILMNDNGPVQGLLTIGCAYKNSQARSGTIVLANFNTVNPPDYNISTLDIYGVSYNFGGASSATLTATLTDGSTISSNTFGLPRGEQGVIGPKGQTGDPGKDGAGITKIEVVTEDK